MARIRAASAVVLCLVLVSTACSKEESSSSTSKATTTAKATTTTAKAGGTASADDLAKVREVVANSDFEFTDTEADCLTSKLLERFDATEAARIATDDEPIPEKDLEAASKVFGACVSANSYAAGVLGFVFGDKSAVPPELTTCVGQGLEGKVEQMVVEGNSEKRPEELVSTIDHCLTPQTYAALVASSLTQTGLEPATAQCVAEHLTQAIPFAQYMTDFGSEDPPPEVSSARDAAGQACGTAA